MCNERHGIGVHGDGKSSSGTLFAPSFICKTKPSPPPPQMLGALSTLPVNKAGMGLQNPVTSTQDKYTRSQHASDDMIDAVKSK